MVSRKNFSMCSKAFIREEGELFYLFHAENGAILKFKEDPETILKTKDPETVRIVTKLLEEHGFISSVPQGEAGPSIEAWKKWGQPLNAVFGEQRSTNSPFQVLWAVSGHCNLRCVYCFPDIPNISHQQGELTTDEAMIVADRIIDGAVLEVTLSGGEPFLRKDFFAIVKKLKDANLSVAAITNGTTMTERIASQAAEMKLILGLSLDAPEESINRLTRGDGVFPKVERTIEIFTRHKVIFSLICTVTRHNFTYLEKMARFAREKGIRGLVLQDLRVFGNKKIYDETRLSPKQEEMLPELIQKLEQDYSEISITTLELLMYKNYELICPAGAFNAYIDPKGNLFPCTSLPYFNLGNLIEDDLIDLWQKSECIQKLRRYKEDKKSAVIASCQGCEQWPTCHGGCRGDAIFYSGDIDGLPSRCPRNNWQK